MTTKQPQGFRAFSDEVVRERTGKGWAEWFAILDQWGAPQEGHTKSAKYILDTYEVSPWWAQAVTIRYEWERGLRQE